MDRDRNRHQTLTAPSADAPFVSARRLPPLWTLVAVQLEPLIFDYRPPDIAPLLGITVEQVRFYCQDLWPDWKGQWTLDFDQAAVLIYRICRGARNIPERDELFARLKSEGLICEDFPHGDARMQRALKAVEADRRERCALRGECRAAI